MIMYKKSVNAGSRSDMTKAEDDREMLPETIAKNTNCVSIDDDKGSDESGHHCINAQDEVC